MKKTRIIVFTGAGISAESGLKTFRGADGLWEGYRVEDVATPEAWARDPDLVQHFYNVRRKQCIQAQPNAAHRYLADLEKEYDVHIITQNIDDLHERAGSTKVLHLHGEIRKSQSSVSPNLIYNVDGEEIGTGDVCALGSRLRPHVVWFGEAVPNMVPAFDLVSTADVFVVVGTSLQVYPAASLLYEITHDCTIVLIDPNAEKYHVPSNTVVIPKNATEGVRYLAKILAK